MADLKTLPKWSTLARRQALIVLFNRSGGFCVFGHANCLIPSHHYELFIDDLIKDWIASDREQRTLDLKAELRAIHSLGERRYPLRGQFSAISREIYGSNQPLFYIENLGISGITLRPFAKVRVSSSYMRLYVDLGDSLRALSKSKRRKAIRYGKPLPMSVENRVNSKVSQAIKHYLDH